MGKLTSGTSSCVVLFFDVATTIRLIHGWIGGKHVFFFTESASSSSGVHEGWFEYSCFFKDDIGSTQNYMCRNDFTDKNFHCWSER